MSESSYWTRKRLGRRAMLRGAGLGVAGLGAAALIGCGADDEDAAPGTPAATGTAGATATPAVVTEAQKRGGFLRFLLPAGYVSTNLDPHFTENPTSINTVQGKLFYESLINPDYTNVNWKNPYTLVPHLAASWEQVDKITFVLSIRPGVKFHNGATLTAEDVAFTYKRANGPNTIASNWKTRIAGVEVVDQQKVRLIAKTADAEFLEAVNAGIGQVAIMSKNVDAGIDLTKRAIGTGPFKYDRWQTEGPNVATRFDDYWQKGRPYLDGLRISFADDATSSAAFIARDSDILTRNDRVQADPILKAVPDAVTERWPGDIYGIAYNQARTPYNDLRVRRAIHLALNRPDVNAAATFGDGVISSPLMGERAGYTMPNSELLALPGYRAPKDADVAEALKLLDAAGYKAGFKGDLISQSAFAVAPVFGEVIQAQLSKVLKIELKLAPLDAATYTKRRTATPDFDTSIELGGTSAAAGGNVLRWHSAEASAKGMGLKDTELDALIDTAKLEFDNKARGAIFQKMERRLLDQAHYAAVSAPTLIRMSQPWIKDWRDNRSSRASMMNPTWIWMDLTKARADRKTS